MDDIKLMNVLDSSYDLLEDGARFRLWNFFALDNVVEQLSALHVLHYQEQLFGGFDDFVELDYVRVADQLEDVDLA